MLELEDALQKILGSIPPAKNELIPLEHAHRRVISEDVVSEIDLPGFDNSSVDGYAVRSQDVIGASSQHPVTLTIAGKVVAGEVFHGELASGECIRIFTGSPLPAGADSVVMQEDTRTDTSRKGEVLFLDSTKPWENVRFRGEDIKKGRIVVGAGDRLNAAQIALLAACGVAHVKVGCRPSVGLIATGSELKEARVAALETGQIYESNRSALAPLVQCAGGLPVVFPVVPDELEATRETIKRGLADCDIVLTCGGVSVGEMDFVKSAIAELDGEIDFWKVAIKPGRPFVFGRRGSKLLFGLPGNPVSAFVTFLLLVRPALLRWQGAARFRLPVSSGILAEPLANIGTRRHFMRVATDLDGKVHSAGTQASHILSSLALAQGLVDVPPETTLAAGTVVQVLRWE